MIYSAYETKRICFINLAANIQTSLYASLINRDGQLDLSHTIAQFNSRVDLEVKRSYWLDPSGLHVLHEPYILNRQMFHNDPLIIYHRDQINSQLDQGEQEARKERNKQRSIREVIASVKKWRSYHKTKIDGVRVSLLQAADLVGISKKSLDDYFCQLRLGQKYGFDFHSMMDERIGVLRTFVKKHRPKNDRSHKNEKHPKTLKIIDQFELNEPHTSELYPGQQVVMDSSVYSEEDPPSSSVSSKAITEEQNLTPMDRLQEEQLQNQFFKLDQMLKEPTDPFVHFAARDYRDFTRKNSGTFDFANSKDCEMSNEENIMW